jgi:TetR/AcrR family transcriptional regulator, transcriptional repressor for nem operon
MRYPAEQKAETHDKILTVAARSFREHGADGNGIGRVMKDLGMTKGGFYRHFKSKDDLYAAAVGRAFEETGKYAIAAAEAAPKGQELRAIIESYLSSHHANHPETGCPLAFMATEFGRQPLATRKRINRSLLAFAERILPYIPGRNADEKRRRFLLLSSGMAGTLAVARTIVDPQCRERMLADARSFYIEAFARKKTKS